jgi:hypothetical protein
VNKSAVAEAVEQAKKLKREKGSCMERMCNLLLSSDRFSHTLQPSELAHLLCSELCLRYADICSHALDICPQRAFLYPHSANRDLSKHPTDLQFAANDFIPWIQEVYPLSLAPWI